jgi:hypothetical protein
MAKTVKYAFAKNGDMLDQAYKGAGVHFEDNLVFEDRLEYTGYYSTTSGNKFRFKSQITGRLYCMMMTEFNQIILSNKICNKIVEGKFTYCKRSTSQGVKLLNDEL